MRVINVYGDFINEDVDIFLHHQSLAEGCRCSVSSIWVDCCGCSDATHEEFQSPWFEGKAVKVLHAALFAVVDPTLHGETQQGVIDELFHRVDDSLHRPPLGFEMVDSDEIFDHYGSLQLMFSATNDRSQWQVDVVIDDAQGLEHIFQMIRNFGGAKNPYDIHEILIAHQELDPGYKLMLKPAAQKAAQSIPL